jgi:hypothetical protein
MEAFTDDCSATLVMDEFGAIGYSIYDASFTDQEVTFTETDTDTCLSGCGSLEGVLTFPTEAETNGLSALVTYDVDTSKLLSAK